MLPGYSRHIPNLFSFGNDHFLEIQVILFLGNFVPLRFVYIVSDKGRTVQVQIGAKMDDINKLEFNLFGGTRIWDSIDKLFQYLDTSKKKLDDMHNRWSRYR